MRTKALQQNRRSLPRQMVAVLLGCLIPYIVRLFVADVDDNLLPLNLSLVTSLAASLISLAVIRSFDEYPGTEAASSIFSSVSIVYGLTMAVLLIARIDYARGLLFGSYVLCCVFLLIQQLRWPTQGRLRIAIIKGGAAMPFQASNIDWIEAHEPLGSFDGVDAVTVDLRADLSNQWERTLAELALADIPVYHIKHLQESLTGRVELEHLSETSYGTLSPPGAYIILKRGMDTILAASALLLLTPLLLLVAVMVRLDSPGPAIFRQRRIGFRGRPFIVRKFRTMQTSPAGGESRDAAMTRKDDDRITKFGHFLRRSRLDELPQLINVVRGEMSLIGPRPEAEVLSQWYEQEIPFYRYRHVVLPGVTGWAQINQGHVTDVKDVTSKLHYDFYYIKNLSPWIDALIAVRTLLIMFSGQGAK